MKIRKCFLLVMSLVSINFLNLNASESLVSSMKLNLAQKNDKKIFTIEIYQDNEKNEIKKLYELEKLGKIDYSSKIIEQYYENGNLKSRLTDIHTKETLEEYDENGKLINEECGE